MLGTLNYDSTSSNRLRRQVNRWRAATLILAVVLILQAYLISVMAPEHFWSFTLHQFLGGQPKQGMVYH